MKQIPIVNGLQNLVLHLFVIYSKKLEVIIMSKTKIIIEEDVSVGGAELHVPFPLAEYKNRLNKIRKSMQEAEIDLLYVTEPENLFYISGYNVTWFRGNSSTTWNDSTVAGIAIHVDHDKFIQFDLPDEEGVLQHSSICTDQRIYYDLLARYNLG